MKHDSPAPTRRRLRPAPGADDATALDRALRSLLPGGGIIELDIGDHHLSRTVRVDRRAALCGLTAAGEGPSI